MGARSLLMLAGIIAAGAPALAEPVTLSGLVAYREGLPLPPEATTTVRLLENEAGAAPTVVAETSVGGRTSPPIPFELTYDTAAVQGAPAYALEALITLGERVLFRSPAPQPLKTPAVSQKVSLVVRLARDPS